MKYTTILHIDPNQVCAPNHEIHDDIAYRPKSSISPVLATNHENAIKANMKYIMLRI